MTVPLLRRARSPGRRPTVGGARTGANRRSDSGISTLEYVVIFPFFLLLVAVGLQGALWYAARNAALASAQEGLRAARAQHGNPGAGQAAAVAFAADVGSGQLLQPAAQVTVGANQTLTVTVSGSVPSFVPGLTIRVNQRASGPKERWVSPGGHP